MGAISYYQSLNHILKTFRRQFNEGAIANDGTYPVQVKIRPHHDIQPPTILTLDIKPNEETKAHILLTLEVRRAYAEATQSMFGAITARAQQILEDDVGIAWRLAEDEARQFLEKEG